MNTTVYACDLYCGAGGLTTALIQAAEEKGICLKTVAVNHWTMAIRTHSINHPDVEHLCNDVGEVDPMTAIPGGYLHLLCAGIECTHHSNARGGKPMSDQRRSSAWDVLKWCRNLFVENLFIENVREFQNWGPLYPSDHPDARLRDRPIPEEKGKFYREFLDALIGIGYKVETRIVNAADYGDPTSRRRFFLQANRTGETIHWPLPSHGKKEKPHRAAREIIDWNLKGKSIFKRKKPLADATMRRIMAGMQKFNEAFLVIFRNNQGAQDLDRPLPTMTTSGANFGICEPFFIGTGGPQGSAKPASVDEPLGTVLTENHRGIVEPFLYYGYGGKDAVSLDAPLPTVCASYEHLGVVEPYIIPVTHSGGENRCHDIDVPLPTVTCAHRGELALVEPYLVSFHGGDDGERRTHSLDHPMPTQDTSNRFGLAEPQPYLINYYGNGASMPVEEPLDTITSRDRFALVQPGLFDAPAPGKQEAPRLYLDILFRMLQPHELAAAHSFPKDYIFYGEREDKVKQIGNSIPIKLCKAHCHSILDRIRL